MSGQEGSAAGPAGWLQDPAGRHQYRYWDGAAWTEHVADDGQQAVDPLEAAPVSVDDLRRREAEVESELATVDEELRRASESSNDADMANIMIAAVEERMNPGRTPKSPLRRRTELQEELESIRRRLDEAAT